MYYPLAKNCLSQNDLETLKRFIDRGMFTMGENVKNFENIFEKGSYNVMVNSGSSANLLLIASYVSTGKLKAGDKVIVPAVSWSTTYFPLVQYGLIPVFVDVDHTYQADINEISQAWLKHDAKAIFLVNLLGLMDHGYIETLKNYFHYETEKPLIFLDNCEGYGANIDSHFCDGITHSFFFSHQLNTMEGGMVTFPAWRKQESDHAKSLRAHGWIRDQDDESSLFLKSGNNFKDSFTFVTVGYCLRPLEMSGVMGMMELEKWPETKAIRDANHEHFCEVFADKTYLWLNTLPYSEKNSCFGFPIVLNSSKDRTRVIEALAKSGIDTRPIIGGNFLNQPVMRRISHIADGCYAVAESIDKRGFMIGNYAEDLREKIDLVRDIIEGIV